MLPELCGDAAEALQRAGVVEIETRDSTVEGEVLALELVDLRDVVALVLSAAKTPASSSPV